MKRLIALLLTGVGLAAAGPAVAWDSLDDPDKGGRCAFMQTFDTAGQTTVIVSQDQKEFDARTVHVIIYNRNWSLQAAEPIGFKVSIASNRASLSADDPAAVDNGIALTITEEHMEGFAGASPRLVVVRKDDQAIARLDFAGFGNAWGHFERCRADKIAERNERQKSLDEVPLNPFARAAEETVLPQRATPAPNTAHKRKAATVPRSPDPGKHSRAVRSR